MLVSEPSTLKLLTLYANSCYTRCLQLVNLRDYLVRLHMRVEMRWGLTAERRRPYIGQWVGGVDDSILPNTSSTVLDTRLAASSQLHVVERTVRRRRFQLKPVERQADSQCAGCWLSRVVHVDG